MGEGRFGGYDLPAAGMPYQPGAAEQGHLGRIDPPRPVSMLDRIGQLEKEMLNLAERLAGFEREVAAEIKILRQTVEQAVGIQLP